jgi:hypothetical protein
MASKADRQVFKGYLRLRAEVEKLHDPDPVIRSRARDYIFGEFAKHLGYSYQPSPLSLCRPRRKQRGTK